MRRLIPLLAVTTMMATGTAHAATSCQTVVKRTPARHYVWIKLRRRENGHRAVVRYHGRTVYVRVRRGYTRTERERVCTSTIVEQVPAPAPPPVPIIKAHVHIGPYVQDPNNALAGTFSYSASATETINGVTGPAHELPEGVLTLYNDGSLACSINVGGSTTGGECAVTYSQAGEHTLILIYQAAEGAGATTETEKVQIGGGA